MGPDPVQSLPADLVQRRDEAVFVVDANGQITHWSPGAERLFGWKSHEITGAAPDRLFAPDGGGWAAVTASARAGTWRWEGRSVNREQQAVPVVLELQPTVGASSEPAGLVVTAKRLPARAEASADFGAASVDVRQRLGTLRSLLHSLTDGVFLVSAEGDVSVCNMPLADYLGLPASDVKGQPYGALFDALADIALEPAPVRHDLEQALLQIERQPVVYLTTRPPESLLLQVRLFPVQDESGTPLGWGGLVRDLTRADELNVLATVTHELRTPLAAIKGYVTTLLENYGRWDLASVQEFLETIDESADQLSRLVENLLDFSRLEANRLTLQRRNLDVAELAARLVEDTALQNRPVQFEVQFAEAFPQVWADPLRVRQVLANLLQNAVKFSPARSLITVSGQVAGRGIVVRVQDQGSGVPPEERERIFERFYQAEGTAQASGVGLGLYIARRIVEAHGGRIWVEDPPQGQGTVFAFELPIDNRSAAATAVEPPPAAWAARPEDQLRVLVVEDDRRLIHFVRANLEASGYGVLTALDGESGLETFQREQPDLLLLDVGLPKLDGYAVCERVREFSAVPIIMLTARTSEADRVRGLDLGADDYLTKPFGVKELLARVRAALRRSQVPDEVRTQPVLSRGDLTIDFARRQVTVAGRPVSLTPTEYKLLYHLAINAGQVLTHEQLLRKVWGSGYETETSYLWVYISRLRKKLEPDSEHPRYLLSETGVGYRFSD
jgi:PAS domain S-box-containing protein